MCLTVISIFVTLISIACSIWSYFYARKAKSYKEKAKQVIGIANLKTLSIQFADASRTFINATRDETWYKGIDPNVVINPYSNVLIEFSDIYPFLNDPAELKALVNNVSGNVQQYIRASSNKKKETVGNIKKIIELLSQFVHENLDKL